MINKVILVGNVGMDPEIRTTESGVKVARVRLATTERIYDRQSNETRELTEWHTITLWRGLADVVDRFVRKGSQLYVEGSLRTREWTDRDNNKRYSTEVVASEMKLLGRRSDNPGGQGQGGNYGGGYSGGAPAGGYPNAPAGGNGGYGGSATGGNGYGADAAGSNGGGYPSGDSYGQRPAAPAQPAPVTPPAPAEDPDDLPF